MGSVRLAALAVMASLTLTGLVCAPVALAAPGAKPSPKPPKSRSASSRPPKTMAPPKPPPEPCNPPRAFPASQIQGVPWAQSRLGFTNAWEYSTGKGVTVAVVDSGVNAGHPQLAGRVRGIDLSGTHNTDCEGHGTQAAGIIAARDDRNSGKAIPFVGVAPDVRLISVKVQNNRSSGDDGTLLARGIERAVQEGADIINVSIQNTDYPLLRHAVRVAQRKDVLIVAAAGNTDPQKKDSEQEAYPATYPGVLSVGAIDASGALSNFSNSKSRVDVSAPGAEIISTQSNGYIGGLNGTSYAAPYVTGVAALIKSEKPNLTSRQIINRIVATADSNMVAGSGAGMVNPLRAVTALIDDNASPTATRQAGAQPIDIGGPPPVDHRSRQIGGLLAAGTIGMALLVVFGGVVAPLGARRKWKPGRAAPLPDDSAGSPD
jgi:type VII secretion-associated serine protease mycosin